VSLWPRVKCEGNFPKGYRREAKNLSDELRRLVTIRTDVIDYRVWVQKASWTKRAGIMRAAVSSKLRRTEVQERNELERALFDFPSAVFANDFVFVRAIGNIDAAITQNMRRMQV